MLILKFELVYTVHTLAPLNFLPFKRERNCVKEIVLTCGVIGLVLMHATGMPQF